MARSADPPGDHAFQPLLTPDDYGKILGAGADRLYITKEGDTLDDVAAFFYGDSTARQRMLENNPELSPDEGNLPPGMRLRVGTAP